MRHCRLIPERLVKLVRECGTGAISDPDIRVGDVSLTRIVYPTRGDGISMCRCCGYHIKNGDPAYRVGVYWSKYQSTFTDALIHREPCVWGEAHEKEPPTEPTLAEKRARAKFKARRRAPKDRRELNKPHEMPDAGPLTIRFVDPATLRGHGD